MSFISLKTYLKLNENISLITQKYSELVTIAKEFENILGEKEVKTSGLLDSLKKLNEIILDYKEIEDIEDISTDLTELPVQPDAEIPVQPNFPVQPGDVQPDDVQLENEDEEEVQVGQHAIDVQPKI